MNILILGANGFIGSHLCAYILEHRDWHITAMDIRDDNVRQWRSPRFHFTKGDIRTSQQWMENEIAKCDVVLPLVAIATPALYMKDPLAVFELDFEANLEIVRIAAAAKKRIIFPSTSEVYGMSPDIPYDEETSMLATGPIHKERWIYSTSKQLLDRVIYAYGAHRGLEFTLFRPFNWFGPRLDNVLDKNASVSRVVSQFLSDIIHRRDIVLVDGGAQKRCFLYVDDAIDALVRIIENKNNTAGGRIFNIGDPKNNISIKTLAETMLDVAAEFPEYKNIRAQLKITSVAGEEYFGKSYQDIAERVPKIDNAKKYLGWTPAMDLREGIRKTIDYYLSSSALSRGSIAITN